MQVSLIRQTPVASILLMLMLVVAAFVRFATAPYGDELLAGGATLPGMWVDAFHSKYPAWGTILSAVVVMFVGVGVGRNVTSLGLYQARTTVSIPLYAILSCGIFIASDSLAVALSSYFVLQMLRYLCGGYVRGTDFNFAFFAGFYAALAPMFYSPALLFALLLPVAVLMFGLSWREIVVMIAGLLLPFAAISYIHWLCGGDFAMPMVALSENFVSHNGYTLWGSESVVALTMMGLSLFVVICAILSFFGDKRTVALRQRTILAFYIVVFVVACAAFALPSATTGVFMLVALPASVLMPVVLLRLSDAVSNLVIVLFVVLMILHFFVA